MIFSISHPLVMFLLCNICLQRAPHSHTNMHFQEKKIPNKKPEKKIRSQNS